MASLTALGVALRQWLPLRAPPAATAAPQLLQALDAGQTLGGQRFEGGAVALLIVEVRDALQRQVVQAGRAAQARRDLKLASSLADVSRRLGDDTFVQHLINTVLGATGLYTEAQPLELTPRLVARTVDAVTALLGRSWCVLLTRSDAARMALGAGDNQISLPAPIAQG